MLMFVFSMAAVLMVMCFSNCLRRAVSSPYTSKSCVVLVKPPSLPRYSTILRANAGPMPGSVANSVVSAALIRQWQFL